MGPVFEAICRDWMWRQFASGGLGFEFTDIGRWWGNDPAIREEAEIDVVAVNGSETVLVGECKWRNEPTDAAQLEKLDRRAGLVDAKAAVPRWFFSRAGYTKGCREYSRGIENARLITFEDMVVRA